MRERIITRLEELEGSVKVVFADVREHRGFLVAHLLVSAQDYQQEAGVGLADLVRVPLCANCLVDVTANASANGSGRRQGGSERKMDTRREEGVDEASSVTDDAGMRNGVRLGVVGKVRRRVDVRDLLCLGAQQLGDHRGELETLSKVLLDIIGRALLLSCDSLVPDNSDRVCAIVQRNVPDPAALVCVRSVSARGQCNEGRG